MYNVSLLSSVLNAFTYQVREYQDMPQSKGIPGYVDNDFVNTCSSKDSKISVCQTLIPNLQPAYNCYLVRRYWLEIFDKTHLSSVKRLPGENLA